MKYQFEESGFTDKNYFPLSPNFRRNPKVFWVYHDNDCIPKWKNPGEAKLINHYLSDVIFGATLGIAVGKGFGHVYRQNRKLVQIRVIPFQQTLCISMALGKKSIIQ